MDFLIKSLLVDSNAHQHLTFAKTNYCYKLVPFYLFHLIKMESLTMVLRTKMICNNQNSTRSVNFYFHSTTEIPFWKPM